MPIMAQRALKVRLVNRVVPAADVMATAIKLAGTIGQQPWRGPRDQAADGPAQELPLAEAWTHIPAAVAETLASSDAVEGATAFLERREPVWTH